ncbi:MAG TPA: lysophospholipid acyltransferase family protein [Gammaproteobacteria bacterium]|nr:lysophospholipid acyltransferase family protein [Gammaproteobacteria bacterium]
MGRSWRLFATALAFALFGIAAVVVNVLYFVPVRLLTRGAARRRLARSGIRVSYKAFLQLLALLGVVRFDLDRAGLAALGGAGTVIVANHPTLLDVIVLLAYVEQAGCVVKKTLWRNPFVSVAITAAGYIPSNDPEHLLRDCDEALKRNESLIVFPEATRTVPGEPLRLHRGAAAIALESGAELQIVHLSCEPVLLPKGAAWYRIPDVRPCLAARVGASLRARDFQADGANRSVAARHLTLALQHELSRGIRLDARAGTGAQTTTH